MTEKEAKIKLKQIEATLSKQYEKISDISLFNTQKILKAFQNKRVALSDFACSTGYGYDDQGKTKLSALYAEIFKGEGAIVSPLITCGTHILSSTLFGLLRPGDLFVSIGECYDTLKEVINGSKGSLKSWGINYKLINYNGKASEHKKIEEKIKQLSPKLVFIQRSKGYTDRKDGYSIAEIKDLINLIKRANKKSIIMIDNCYGEFTDKKEPLEVGADIIAGSLIKNPGGGIAPTGAYVVGKKKYIEQVAEQLTAPSLGSDVGSYNASYQNFFQGLFLSPHTTSRVLKASMLLGKTLEYCGITSDPLPGNIPHDIVRSIEFKDRDKLIKFIQDIQKQSPVDSHVKPMPWAMPGYKDEVIMAAGTFIQGSSIELSCDAPLKEPYTAYIQGSLTYEHMQIVCLNLLIENCK